MPGTGDGEREDQNGDHDQAKRFHLPGASCFRLGAAVIELKHNSYCIEVRIEGGGHRLWLETVDGSGRPASHVVEQRVRHLEWWHLVGSGGDLRLQRKYLC